MAVREWARKLTWRTEAGPLWLCREIRWWSAPLPRKKTPCSVWATTSSCQTRVKKFSATATSGTLRATLRKWLTMVEAWVMAGVWVISRWF
jgi:hypothetical protein